MIQEYTKVIFLNCVLTSLWMQQKCSVIINMIKAILFDMDGVLIEAKEWHFEALNRALELFGHTISLESHLSLLGLTNLTN